MVLSVTNILDYVKLATQGSFDDQRSLFVETKKCNILKGLHNHRDVILSQRGLTLGKNSLEQILP